MSDIKNNSKPSKVQQEVMDEMEASMQRRARPPLSGVSDVKNSLKNNVSVSVEHERSISDTYDLIVAHQENDIRNREGRMTASVSRYLNWLKHKKNPLYKGLVEPKVSEEAAQLAQSVADSLGGADLIGWGAVESPVFRRSFTVATKRNTAIMKFFFENKSALLTVFDEMTAERFKGENCQSELLHEIMGFAKSSYPYIDDAFNDLRGMDDYTMRTENNPNDPPQVSYYPIVLSTVLWEILKHIESHFNKYYSL